MQSLAPRPGIEPGSHGLTVRPHTVVRFVEYSLGWPVRIELTVRGSHPLALTTWLRPHQKTLSAGMWGVWWGWKGSNLLDFRSTVLQTAATHHLRRIPAWGINNSVVLTRSYGDDYLNWSGWSDLHGRPHVPETCALLPELHPGRLVEAVPCFS